MTKLTEIQTVQLEKHAALFWLNEMARVEWMATPSKIAFIEARLIELKDLPDAPEGDSPARWDWEATLRYPFIERIGRQLHEKLALVEGDPWGEDIE